MADPVEVKSLLISCVRVWVEEPPSSALVRRASACEAAELARSMELRSMVVALEPDGAELAWTVNGWVCEMVPPPPTAAWPLAASVRAAAPGALVSGSSVFLATLSASASSAAPGALVSGASVFLATLLESASSSLRLRLEAARFGGAAAGTCRAHDRGVTVKGGAPKGRKRCASPARRRAVRHRKNPRSVL